MSCCPEITNSAGGNSISNTGDNTVGVKPPEVRSLFNVATIDGGRFGNSLVPITAPDVIRNSLTYSRSLFYTVLIARTS